jgi:hypothetical protein
MTTDLQVAGHKLAQMRVASELTQQQLELKTAELEARGFGKRVYAQQISRIEKGQLDKPPILDLLSIGTALRMSTAQVLQLYGLWTEAPTSEVHPALQKAQEVLDRLDDEEAERMLGWIEFAVTQARADLARRQATSPPARVEAGTPV